MRARDATVDIRRRNKVKAPVFVRPSSMRWVLPDPDVLR